MTDFEKLWRSYSIWDNQNIKGFFGKEYKWLSNFHLCDVWFEGVLYPSSEHAYMAAKTLNLDIRQKFSKSPRAEVPKEISPSEYFGFCEPMTCAAARKFGQTIELRPDWENIKYDIMLAVVFDKFWRNHDIRQKLLDTGDKYLEETNHWSDRVWGVDYKTGIGNNWLGKILIKIRDIL